MDQLDSHQAQQMMMFQQLQQLIQQQNDKIAQLESKVNAIPVLQHQVDSLQQQNKALVDQVTAQQHELVRLMNVQQQQQQQTSSSSSSSSSSLSSSSAPPTSLTSTITQHDQPLQVTSLIPTLPQQQKQQQQPVTLDLLSSIVTMIENYLNTKFAQHDNIITNDITNWIEYLYLNSIRSTQFTNVSNALIKTEFKRLEEWLYYLESQLSSQYDLLVQMQQRSSINAKAKRHYISYHKWLELKDLFPEQYYTLPNGTNTTTTSSSSFGMLYNDTLGTNAMGNNNNSNSNNNDGIAPLSLTTSLSSSSSSSSTVITTGATSSNPMGSTNIGTLDGISSTTIPMQTNPTITSATTMTTAATAGMMIPTGPNTPSTTTTLTDLLSNSTTTNMFKTYQQRLDDDLISKQQHALLLEQQRLHQERERKKCIELQTIAQRQRDLLVQTKLLQQPFAVRSGLTLQLQTSQQPDSAVIDMQRAAIIGMVDNNNNRPVQHHIPTTLPATFEQQQLELILNSLDNDNNINNNTTNTAMVE